MRVFKALEDVRNIEETVIALGNFDGVHKGHQQLIYRAVSAAKAAGLKSAVFTFTNHPKNVMTGENIVKNILTFEDKVHVIEKLGVDYLFTVDFTQEIRNMGAEQFVKEILMEKLKMREACCGFNYSFGKKGAGKVELLGRMCLENACGFHVLQPIKIDGQVVSSTLIRDLISKGDMEEAKKYLGRNYSVGGTVVKGNQIGRTIGFRTSNILLDETMVTPKHGVYATYLTYNWTEYKGITNVGIKPTIGDEKKTIETHIFDFCKDIYDKEIKVEFLKKLRDEVKFQNIDKLAEQIEDDCRVAKEYHENQLA